MNGIATSILSLGHESKKFLYEATNPAKLAEHYVFCYESVEGITLSLFDHLDINVNSNLYDGTYSDTHNALLQTLANPGNPLHELFGQGPVYVFLSDANSFRSWLRNPDTKRGTFQDIPSRSKLVDGFQTVKESLFVALRATRKSVESRWQSESLWELMRYGEIKLAIKDETLTVRERVINELDAELHPLRDIMMKNEEDLKQSKRAHSKELELFHAQKSKHQVEWALDAEDLERAKEELVLQRLADAEELKLCYTERANDHEEVEREILKLEEARLVFRAQAVSVQEMRNLIMSYHKSEIHDNPGERQCEQREQVDNDLESMIKQLLTDLIQAKIEKNSSDTKMRSLQSEVYRLKAQLAVTELYHHGASTCSTEGDGNSEEEEDHILNLEEPRYRELGLGTDPSL